MNTNIVIALDTRRPKNDSTYPLVLRLCHQRTTIPIPIGISLQQKDWDDKNRLVKKSYQGVTGVARLNNIIQKKRAESMDIIMKLDELGQLQSLSVSELKERIYRPVSNQSFFSFTNKLIDDLKATKHFGTARSYKGVINVLKKFCNNKDLQFKNINYKFLNSFEINHTAKGNTANGLSVYMRAIRAIYNKAIKSGIVEKEHYPFDVYKIKSVPTEKRALEWELLQRIITSKINSDHLCFNARNYFVASYMMYGMNFIDMAFLKRTDIKDGRIYYRRRKTSRIYDIKVTDSLQEIFNYYRNKNNGEYIFPIINRSEPDLIDRDIQWARKRYNKKLKLLADHCKIERNLTSYVSRHSFATQAMLLQVPLNAISAMLGHSNLKTTEIYLKSLPTAILDDYNSKVIHR